MKTFKKAENHGQVTAGEFSWRSHIFHMIEFSHEICEHYFLKYSLSFILYFFCSFKSITVTNVRCLLLWALKVFHQSHLFEDKFFKIYLHEPPEVKQQHMQINTLTRSSSQL